MRNKTIAVVGVTLVGALAGASAVRQDEEVMRQFMHQKLGHTERVLEGLVTDDLDRVAEAADSMMGLMDDPRWQAIQTPEYVQLSTEFRRSLGRLSATARAKNMDGASLAFVQMTTDCFECHRFAREER